MSFAAQLVIQTNEGIFQLKKSKINLYLKIINKIEKRNRDAWDIATALKNLELAVINLLQNINR